MKHIFNKLSENIVIINQKNDIIFCNNSFLETLGYIEGELIKKNVSFISDEKVENIIDNNKDENIDITFNKKNKESIILNCNIVPNMYNGEKAIFLLCSKKEYYTKEQLDTLLDNVQGASWIKDKDGKYIYANKYLAKLANKTKIEMLGNDDIQNFENENSYRYAYIDKEIKKNKKAKLLEEIVNVHGVDKKFESYKAPILDENGEVVYIVGTSRDISLTKKIEEQVFSGYNDVLTLCNILNKENKDVKELLENICNDFFKYLNSTGFSIYLYNKEENQLKSYIKLGYELSSVNTDIIDTSGLEDDFFKLMPEGIISLKEVTHIENYLDMKKEGIEYIGVYKIELRNDLIGILTVSYKDKNKPKYEQDDFIKAICGQIAILLKNIKLSQEIKIENEKRSGTEKELELFLDTAVDLIGIVGDNGYFKKINSKWMEVLGWSQQELLNNNLKILIHDEDLNKIVKMKNLEKTIKGSKNTKCRFLTKNGNYIWLYIASRYIKEENHFVVTAKDISKEMYIEQQTKKLEKAIEVESIKNEFFSNISHEFKTPLNIILGSMQLLEQNVNKEILTKDKLINHINIIRQNSYRLLRLVNNLIDISKIDTGFYKLQLSNNNIVSIIEDITLSVVNYVEGKNINLIFDTNTESEVIACDPDKIERIMLNLLSNAIKYTEEDGEIKVTVTSDSKNVRVSVKDNGTGIPSDKLKIIFDRFSQVDDTLIKKREGSGIGLSLVKSLVKMHGGDIYVKSEVKKGSEFIFDIPITKTKQSNKAIMNKGFENSQIEKCSIEFSDIYKIF